MEENNTYLKYLINDQIYVVEEPKNEVEKEKEEALLEEPVQMVEEPKTGETEAISTPEIAVPIVPSKKLLVVFDYPDSEPLPVHLKKLMLKIIEAVGIDVMSGVYINASFKSLPDQLLDFENILVFGQGIELPLDDYENGKVYGMQNSGSTRILVADTLRELDQQIPLKKQLWAELQKMFPAK
ncbi:MAG: hypothetical protein AAGC88_06905 [Bacteroidota bacterium]